MLATLGQIIKHQTIANALVFTSTGYVPISSETYEDSKISYSFASPLKKIGLIPKYLSDDNFLFVTIDNENQMVIGAIVKGSEKTYGIVDVSGKLVQTNTLEVYSEDNRFIVSLNGQQIYQFQSALFVYGSVRIWGEQNEVIYSADIEERQSNSWLTNAGNPMVEIKQISIEENSYVKLSGKIGKIAEIKQLLTVATGLHTFSFKAQGNGKFSVKTTGGTVLHQFPIAEQELSFSFYTFTIATAQNVYLVLETESELTVGKFQLEKKQGYSSYIPNESATESAVRQSSRAIFPTKDLFDVKSGSIYVKFSTINELPEGQELLASEDKSLLISVAAGEVLFKLGDNLLAAPLTLEAQSSYEILASWNPEKVDFAINGENLSAINEGTSLVVAKQLIFADGISVKEELILEEWALFNNKIAYDADIQSQIPFAVMQSLFEGGISGQNVTWSELPVAPSDHSPILVQKEDGTTMQKVSFFDFETGVYRRWNQEAFVYDGKTDYLEVAYKNLDEQFRDISIRTEAGEKIGEPYQIDGKRFYFSMYEGLKETLKNQVLYATYQVNDSYTIDYNIEAVDGYRIDFAKHDGQKRIVYQEGNRFGESKKLATMIDMNPIQNQNHEGFLYVTETVNKAESFRVTATPDRLHADGASFATLIIEPLDYQGNFLTHANLEIKTTMGFIARHISKDAAEAQKRSGQYLFQYHAPYIQSSRSGEVIEDHIWIIDRESNIGVSYKMLLSPVTEVGKYRLSKSEKEMLAKKTTLINAILMYEGVESYEDAELVDILDLDRDGRITMEDILVLETNQKDQELAGIIGRLTRWEAEENAIETA